MSQAARVVALRGATSLEADTRDQVMERTGELVTAMMHRNGLVTDDVISLLLTATDDITAAFPAAAVRACGFADVPVICARELDVRGGGEIPLCIRVMAHVYSPIPRAEVQHVYLREARRLRSDLPG